MSQLSHIQGLFDLLSIMFYGIDKLKCSKYPLLKENSGTLALFVWHWEKKGNIYCCDPPLVIIYSILYSNPPPPPRGSGKWDRIAATTVRVSVCYERQCKNRSIEASLHCAKTTYMPSICPNATIFPWSPLEVLCALLIMCLWAHNQFSQGMIGFGSHGKKLNLFGFQIQNPILWHLWTLPWIRIDLIYLIVPNPAIWFQIHVS